MSEAKAESEVAYERVHGPEPRGNDYGAMIAAQLWRARREGFCEGWGAVILVQLDAERAKLERLGRAPAPDSEGRDAT